MGTDHGGHGMGAGLLKGGARGLRRRPHRGWGRQTYLWALKAWRGASTALGVEGWVGQNGWLPDPSVAPSPPAVCKGY